MTLSEYIKASDTKRSELASAIGVAPTYLYQMEHGLRSISPARAVQLERATSGAVSRRELRPTDWHLIWPELADGIEPASTPVGA
jgi:DNA-binding transcriptional regulator YdaS (Cro superfamily)